MNRVFTGLARLAMLGVACSVMGCAQDSTAVAQSSARRSNVAPPFITLLPASIALAPGASAVLTAKPQGGEAMLFSVEWKVREGAAGGTIKGGETRNPDGTFDATYTAPATAGGPFHVIATIREY